MSFCPNLFGGKKKAKEPTTEDAIQKLREPEEMLTKKVEFLEEKIELEVDIAKKNAVINKRAAIQALKRKKYYTKRAEQIDGTITRLEILRGALEDPNTNAASLMEDVANVVEEAHKYMDVDQGHNLIDDVTEQQDIARETSDTTSNPVLFENDVEEELEKELEELKQECLKNEFPEEPQGEVVKPTSTAEKVEYDDDIKELAAWAP